MLILVSYDICTTSEGGAKRLMQVAKTCQNHGQRVQNSVFECILDNTQFLELKKLLGDIINEKTDSLRFYQLGNNYAERVEKVGVNKCYEPEGLLLY